jgi:hypothetical protein
VERDFLGRLAVDGEGTAGLEGYGFMLDGHRDPHQFQFTAEATPSARSRGQLGARDGRDTLRSRGAAHGAAEALSGARQRAQRAVAQLGER